MQIILLRILVLIVSIYHFLNALKSQCSFDDPWRDDFFFIIRLLLSLLCGFRNERITVSVSLPLFEISISSVVNKSKIGECTTTTFNDDKTIYLAFWTFFFLLLVFSVVADSPLIFFLFAHKLWPFFSSFIHSLTKNDARTPNHITKFTKLSKNGAATNEFKYYCHHFK